MPLLPPKTRLVDMAPPMRCDRCHYLVTVLEATRVAGKHLMRFSIRCDYCKGEGSIAVTNRAILDLGAGEIPVHLSHKLVNEDSLVFIGDKMFRVTGCRIDVSQDNLDIRTVSSPAPLGHVAGPSEFTLTGTLVETTLTEGLPDQALVPADATETPEPPKTETDKLRAQLGRVVHEYQKEYGPPLDDPPSDVDQSIIDAETLLFETGPPPGSGEPPPPKVKKVGMSQGGGMAVFEVEAGETPEVGDFFRGPAGDVIGIVVETANSRRAPDMVKVTLVPNPLL